MEVKKAVIILFVLCVIALGTDLYRFYQGTLFGSPDLITADVENAAEPPFYVSVDGRNIYFKSVPKIIEGVTYVPLRELAEKTEFFLEWNTIYRSALVYDDLNILFFMPDTETALVNGRRSHEYGISKFIDGTTYVSLRFFMEKTGNSVSWNNETRTVEVNSDTEKPGNKNELQRGEIVQISSEDSFIATVEGEFYRIKIIGINSIASSMGLPYDSFAEKLLTEGRQVYLEKDPNYSDEKGILYRYVWLQKPNLSEDMETELKKHNFTFKSIISGNSFLEDNDFMYKEMLEGLEKTAIRYNVGLWGYLVK